MPEADHGKNLTLLDACAVINFYATGHLADIVSCVRGRVAVSSIVERESLYIAGPDGLPDRELIDLSGVVQSGLIEVLSPDTDEELYRFLDFAIELDDGEAMTLALAARHGAVVVTDDRKAVRVAAEDVETVPSLAIIRAWFDADGISSDAQRDALSALQSRASYVPGRTHPYRDWWQQILEREG